MPSSAGAVPTAHDAGDLTPAFFTHLLEKEPLKKVNRQKGRFRSFLLAAATDFPTGEWDKRQTLKRGGQNQVVALDEMAAEELYSPEPAGALTPEKLFERRRAFTLVNQMLVRLAHCARISHSSRHCAKTRGFPFWRRAGAPGGGQRMMQDQTHQLGEDLPRQTGAAFPQRTVAEASIGLFPAPVYQAGRPKTDLPSRIPEVESALASGAGFQPARWSACLEKKSRYPDS